MREVITIVKLLSLIKNAKNQLDAVYESIINNETYDSSNLLVNIYNENTNCSITGNPVDDTKRSILKINSLVNNSINKLQKLQLIKDEINSKIDINIPKSIEDSQLIQIKLSQALILTSKRYKSYQLEYIDRLVGDFSKVSKALEERQNKALSSDKIDTYVKAKMNSYGFSSSINNNISNKTYKEFSNEYIEANKYILLDPLDIGNNAFSMKSKLLDYFEYIETAIREVNAITKIWIDMEKLETSDCISNDYWGFV